MRAYWRVITRSFQLVSRLGSRLPMVYISKRRAQRRFVQELKAYGLPAEAVQTLAESYNQMVIVNPLRYLKVGRVNRP